MGMKELTAAISIGTKGISMKICEMGSNSLEILEDVHRRIGLGQDIFDKQRVARATIDDCLAVLRDFTQLCREYGVSRPYAAVTPALREADNADIFFDNLVSFTGVEVELLSLNRELEYYYRYLQAEVLSDSPSGILKVGGGSSLLSLLDREMVRFSRAVPVGPLRMRELFLHSGYDDAALRDFQEQVIRHEFQSYQIHLPRQPVEELLIIGPEAKLLADHGLAEKETGPAALRDLEERLDGLSAEELFRQYGIPLETTDYLLSTVQIISQAAQVLRVKKLRFLPTVILDGMLQTRLFNRDEQAAVKKIETQLIEDALNLGRSFSFDEPHARKILEFTLHLYRKTEFLHKLPPRARLYLAVAALLHDIGQSIAIRAHHKHSQYILRAQNMLFLSSYEMDLIGFISRYHRKSLPKKSHTDYQALPQEDRITVLKAAALLRLCDSLDYSHLQLVESLEVNVDGPGGRILLEGRCREKPLGEIHSFSRKKDLMESLFGVQMEFRAVVDG